MKSFAADVAKQFTAIFLAAFGAAAIAFISSIAGQSGLDCTVPASPQDAGLLGALFKGVHSAFTMNKFHA